MRAVALDDIRVAGALDDGLHLDAGGHRRIGERSYAIAFGPGGPPSIAG